MFDFIFGGKKRIELIRDLLEQRMADHGYSDLSYRLKIKQMGNLELIGTPEGSIVTIVATVIDGQKSKMSLYQILESIEKNRRKTGQNYAAYISILNLTRGNPEQAGLAVPEYCLYRLNLEYPDVMTYGQFENAFSQAVEVLAN